MFIRLILLLIFNHLLCDFIFQNDKIKELRFYKKKKKDTLSVVLHSTLKGNLIHSGIHGLNFLLLYLLNNYLSFWFPNFKYYNGITLPIPFVPMILTILLLVISHFVIDELKSIYLSYHSTQSQKLSIFFFDQILHFLSLFCITTLYFCLPNINSLSDAEIYKDPNFFLQGDELLVAGVIILICTAFAGIFIDFFFHYLDRRNVKKENSNAADLFPDSETSSEINRGGFMIGIIERLLILAAILSSQPMLVGFIFTAKSIVRLSKLKEDKFAEYFLIGNSLSFLIAILGSCCINLMF